MSAKQEEKSYFNLNSKIQEVKEIIFLHRVFLLKMFILFSVFLFCLNSIYNLVYFLFYKEYFYFGFCLFIL